ncbi:hypothetical protein GBAR_LOCUS3517 [Geodia barretti]|uniref:Uncharacterized protein n=1 Tax=Geodia barretti TaxID=519541 RepID=A0AA35R5F9_GEOBA|nr:hypothetical protein GBAR_LOCUS3517 [Geodia barretti]
MCNHSKEATVTPTAILHLFYELYLNNYTAVGCFGLVLLTATNTTKPTQCNCHTNQQISLSAN